MVKPFLNFPSSGLPMFSWNLENWNASTWKTKNSIAIKQKQPPEVFCKKSILRNFTNFTGYSWRREHLWATASDKTWYFHCISIPHSMGKNYDVIRLEFEKLFNWIQINMVFKSSCSLLFYKVGVLKNFGEFKRKHLRSDLQ